MNKQKAPEDFFLKGVSKTWAIDPGRKGWWVNSVWWDIGLWISNHANFV